MDTLDIPALRRRLADLLDGVLVRRENGYAVQQQLKILAGKWKGSNNPDVAALLARAQGLVGMVNASPAGDPLGDKAIQDLSAFKHELRSAASASEGER